jgi:hypothetical protein
MQQLHCNPHHFRELQDAIWDTKRSLGALIPWREPLPIEGAICRWMTDHNLDPVAIIAVETHVKIHFDWPKGRGPELADISEDEAAQAFLSTDQA